MDCFRFILLFIILSVILFFVGVYKISIDYSYLIYFNLIVIKLLFIIVEVDYFIIICVVCDIWSKFCK